MPGPLYHWIAINDTSCARSSLPLPNTLVVSPTPQWLVGFPTADAAAEAQTLCLTAPIADVAAAFLAWLADPAVRVLKPNTPEPPTTGPTVWADS